MFTNIKHRARRLLNKMGLIESIQQITDHGEININSDFYYEILKWRALHQGYLAEIHDVECQTIDSTSTRRMATMNMAKVAANEMATLVFNERCEVKVSDDLYNEFIQDVFKKNKFNANFQAQLEFMFAQGGMAIRPYFDGADIRLSFTTAAGFIPLSWDNNRINEALFLSQETKDEVTYNLLEWHNWDGSTYVITNELYESPNGQDLGFEVPLEILYPDMEREIVIENVRRPLFSYFKPNIANNIDTEIPLGVSLYANSLDTIKGIDIAYDSLQREFRLGRKRLIVPATAINGVIDIKTGNTKHYFDTKDEVYEAMDIGGLDSEVFKEVNSTLRIADHTAGIAAQLEYFASQTGFSPGTFTFNGTSMKTATEVVSEQSKTFRTKQSHENVIEQGINDLIDAIGIVAQLYGLHTPPKEYDVTVTFDDSIAEDALGEINKQILLLTSGLQVKYRALMKIYGLTEDEAKTLAQEIKEESSIDQSDVIDFIGTNTPTGGLNQ